MAMADDKAVVGDVVADETWGDIYSHSALGCST